MLLNGTQSGYDGVLETGDLPPDQQALLSLPEDEDVAVLQAHAFMLLVEQGSKDLPGGDEFNRRLGESLDVLACFHRSAAEVADDGELRDMHLHLAGEHEAKLRRLTGRRPVRHRSRGDAGGCDARSGPGDHEGLTVGEEAGDTEGLAPDARDVRLALMLDLHARGLTWEQIAGHFGKDVRTVYRWRREAQRRGITALRDRKPFEFVMAMLDRLDRQRVFTETLRAQAEKAKDTEAVVRWNRELRQIERDTLLVLERSGVLEGRCFPLRSALPGGLS